MKITQKKIREMLEDFKIDLHINTVLEKHKVSPFDFFSYLEENEKFQEEYKKIEEFNYRYLESQVASKAYLVDPTPGVTLELIRYNNKKKFIVKDENKEEEKIYEKLSVDELKNKIKDIQNNLDKYDDDI